ncbi:MAG: T9SS type A sorting domain-containing protein, partial [Bacteroidota bacterium]|nr:T9SS type A sorting domain-containing protein [Bacteroidota bacterium]
RVSAANLGTYIFDDASPLGGKNYYRLILSDWDNHVTYSPVRWENFGKVIPVTIYPNPVHDYVSIRTEIETSKVLIVTITDKAGRTIGVSSFAATPGAIKTISTKELPSGIYNVQVKDTGGKIYLAKEIIKQ